jgi:hypothetical protein
MSSIRRGGFYRNHLVEERAFLRAGDFEGIRPFEQLIPPNGWILHGAMLKSLEKKIDGCREVMELNRSAQLPGAKTQPVPLLPGPGAPFKDRGDAENQQLLGNLPLQSFDPRAHPLVPYRER